LQLHALQSHGINFVSFTPGTTFDLRSRGGTMQERALIYWLLRYAWGWRRQRHPGVYEVLRGSAGLESFQFCVDSTPSEIGSQAGRIDPSLAAAFKSHLEAEEKAAHRRGEQSLQDRFETLALRTRRGHHDWQANFQIIGELRHVLARSCVNALEPDLIILDEFQRFRHLLDGDDPASELAQHLFEQKTARVLLLSATPYKMYTLAEESALDDHYTDFLATARFLMGTQEAMVFAEELKAFRHGLLDLDRIDLDTLRTRRRRVERRLRRVMSRTERLAVRADRNGMLTERPSDGLRLEPSDLRAYVTSYRASRRLGAGEPLEYWKSAPYLLNFMEGYKLKRAFHDGLTDPSTHAALAAILSTGDGLLSMKSVEAYARVDPGNARLRALIHDTIDNEAWRLLWLPPSLHYYMPGAPFDSTQLQHFTKRLVFSAWWVVPQVIASLVSYETERRMMRNSGSTRPNTPEARARLRPLLRFQRQADRLAGLPVFALLYPSPTLARLADPLRLGAEAGAPSTLPNVRQIVELAEQRIARALRSITRAASQNGPVDESWYWAAPVLLDAQDAASRNTAWLGRANLASAWRSELSTSVDTGDSAFGDVLAAVREMSGNPPRLGRVPTDLANVLARLALAGPGVCALRALARAAGGPEHLTNSSIRDGAARAAWGFRTLFNVPEVTSLVRGSSAEDTDVFWRVVLDYCLSGELQAVLDEYSHVLREWLGILDPSPETIGRQLGQAIYDAVSVRAANYRVEDIRPNGGSNLEVEPKNLRVRYALRFGTNNVEESDDVQRTNQVRSAFNSPFWPFVLATTSIGQEGLDFHLYCHAVVHWNLPANPVDLEQREGRVHRFKGHAIRKNVARANAAAAFRTAGRDPWEALFTAARRGREKGDGDLVPYWVYATDGGARIERYVPALPLSREVEKLEQLKRSLAVYRLAFGQPRQDDLATYLGRLSDERKAEVVAELAVDLTPR
jgi:hypothetical protein